MDRVFKSKINESVENHVQQTDYHEMWMKIEQEVASRTLRVIPVINRKGSIRKWVPVSLICACIMFAAIPALAGVSFKWDRILGFMGINNALSNGYGQQYHQSVTNAGVSMTLHAIVSDGEELKALVSFDAGNDIDQFDAYQIEKSQFTDDQGNTEPASVNLYYDASNHKLLGILEARDILQKSPKNLSLNAENLVFYKYKDITLSQELRAGAALVTGSAAYPKIYVESVEQDRDQLTIRYILRGQSQTPESLDPHLVIQNGKESEGTRGQMTLLPYEGEGLLIQQVFKRPAENVLQPGNLHLRYLVEAKTSAGNWSLAFRADGTKSAQADYSRTLKSDDRLQELTGIEITKLRIAPQKITLDLKEDRSMERFKSGVARYGSVMLVVGDREIRGNFNLYEEEAGAYRHVYEFEPSVWYEDWDRIPMKLILEDAKVTKRDPSTHWINLDPPAEKEQFTDMTIDDYLIHFRYYLEGKDLIVESWSDSPGFQGISQSMLRVDGDEVYPEPGNSGPFTTGKKTERYKGGAAFKSIMLNPGFYSYTDPELNMVIDLH